MMKEAEGARRDRKGALPQLVEEGMTVVAHLAEYIEGPPPIMIGPGICQRRH